MQSPCFMLDRVQSYAMIEVTPILRWWRGEAVSAMACAISRSDKWLLAVGCCRGDRCDRIWARGATRPFVWWSSACLVHAQEVSRRTRGSRRRARSPRSGRGLLWSPSRVVRVHTTAFGIPLLNQAASWHLILLQPNMRTNSWSALEFSKIL